MRSSFLLGPWWAIAVAGVVVLAFPGTAAAQRICKVDGNCPKGFQCVDEGAGTDRICLVTSCQTDADCGPALRCMLNAATECTGGRETCHPANYCEPQWEVPCEADRDCGPGFTCTGPGGLDECGPSADAAAAPPYATAERIPCSAVPKPPFPSCNADGGCTPPGFAIPSICQPGSTCIELTWKTCEQAATGSCKVDADCPSTWTCDCGPPFHGEIVLPLKDAGTAAACMRICTPPNQDLENGGVGPIFGGPAMSVPAQSTSSADAGTPRAPTGSGGPMAAPAPSSTTPTTSSSSSSSSQATPGKNDGGGCSIQGGAGNRDTLLAVVVAFGAAAIVRRRQRSG